MQFTCRVQYILHHPSHHPANWLGIHYSGMTFQLLKKPKDPGFIAQRGGASFGVGLSLCDWQVASRWRSSWWRETCCSWRCTIGGATVESPRKSNTQAAHRDLWIGVVCLQQDLARHVFNLDGSDWANDLTTNMLRMESLRLKLQKAPETGAKLWETCDIVVCRYAFFQCRGYCWDWSHVKTVTQTLPQHRNGTVYAVPLLKLWQCMAVLHMSVLQSLPYSSNNFLSCVFFPATIYGPLLRW